LKNYLQRFGDILWVREKASGLLKYQQFSYYWYKHFGL